MATAIKVEDLSKAYQLGQIGTGTLSNDLKRWYARTRGKEDPFLKIGEINDHSVKGTGNVVWSLKDINFEIEQGDAVGIIGKNGAGKSTLLKILSRITSPTTGKITGNGRIASLLEVGTGFHPELTGRENIYLNGAILGMRKKEIKNKFDAIVNFAGVERYIDTPVKRYSSGMYVRLAFAVAAHLDSEILIVDEVLAVGDAEFQEKCLGKMNEVSRNEGRTVLFVSHNLGSVSLLCKKSILLKKGFIDHIGTTDAIINRYLSSTKSSNGVYKSGNNNREIYIESIVISDDTGKHKDQFKSSEDIFINFKIINKNLREDRYRLIVLVQDVLRKKIFSCETFIRQNDYSLKINKMFLVRGDYSINCIIYIPAIAQFDFIDECCNFKVVDAGTHFSHLDTFDYGVVYGNYQWLKEPIY